MAELKRNDFVFTIGYQGETAIVDGAARKRYGRSTAAELLEEGLFRAAFCAALYDGELEAFVPRFREVSGIEVTSAEDLQRLYGVFGIPESIRSVSVVS
ncbi:MAG: hypothetical protein ACLFR8_00560 [Alkalispirochaeta sp.]